MRQKLETAARIRRSRLVNGGQDVAVTLGARVVFEAEHELPARVGATGFLDRAVDEHDG